MSGQRKDLCVFAKTNQSRHYVWPRQASSWSTRPTRLLSMWTRDHLFSTDGLAQWRARRRRSDLQQTVVRSSPLGRRFISAGRQAGRQGRTQKKNLKVKLVMQPGFADFGREGLCFFFFFVILMSWVQGGMTHRVAGRGRGENLKC